MHAPTFRPTKIWAQLSTVETQRFSRWESAFKGPKAFQIQSHTAVMVVIGLTVILTSLGR